MVLAVFALSLSSALLCMGGKQIRWHADYEEAREVSVESGKPVLIFTTFDGCTYCELLRNQTFPDEQVVRASEGFHWVELDRDRDKRRLDRLFVTSYPSILVLGPEDENIHRFEGFKRTDEFLAQLDEARRRYALFEKGEDWDDIAPRPETVIDHAEVEILPAPIDTVARSLAFLGDELFVVQRSELHAIDAQTGAVRGPYSVPKYLLGLCTDGERLYALAWGWTKGDPIYVLDPQDGSTMRTIVTEANADGKRSAAQGIEWYDGRLYVFANFGNLYVLDPQTGVVERVIQTGQRSRGLVFDGQHFATVGDKTLTLFDPESGAVVREVPVNYPLTAVGYRDERYYVMELEVRGHGRDHRRVRLWPEKFVIHKIGLPPR